MISGEDNAFHFHRPMLHFTAMRRKLIAANWKMYSPPEGWDAADSPYKPDVGADIVIFPSFLDVRRLMDAKLVVGGQGGRAEPHGAFTGDVSMAMLKGAGCQYVLCGHSERRKYYKETDAAIAEQVTAAIECGLHPILCVGETKKEHDAGKAKAAVKKQLQAIPLSSYFLLPTSYSLSIAYEPIWAIGTGVNALPDDAQAMHMSIRSLLPKESRESTRIIYGGSVTDLNAADFLAHPDVDGLLVGGASLEPKRFQSIVAAALEI